MIKKILKLLCIFILFAGVTAYIGYAMFNKPKSADSKICKELILKIAENPKANFIDEKSIEKLLGKYGQNPIGKYVHDVNLAEMEKTLKKNQYIDSVECYKTSNGKVCVKVVQRTPIMYILPDSMSAGYYIDNKGNIIQNTCYASNILVATGDITKEYAKTKLVDFGNFLVENEFWDNQIEQLCVQKRRGHEPVVELIQRVGDQTIYLGELNDYQTKLKRLKIFYRKAMPLIGWNKYSRFNLEYPNQVICTKREI